MPRHILAPTPSAEGMNIILEQPFEGHLPHKRIEIIGMPNRPGTIKVTERHGNQGEKMIIHDGEIDREDSNELLRHMEGLRGLPTDPDHDIYGLNERLAFTYGTMWDNGAEEGGTGRLTDEERETFQNAVESIEALARMKARKRGPI